MIQSRVAAVERKENEHVDKPEKLPMTGVGSRREAKVAQA